MTISVFVGASLDGFIARPNGDLDWLPAGGGEPHGYDEFIASVDAIVIGRNTFETVLGRLGGRDRALGQVAEIVHDLDLKDGKYGRPEAAGVGQLLAGLYAAEADDEKRLARGAVLFDDLHASFASGRPAGPAAARVRKGSARGRSAGKPKRRRG